MSVPEGQRICTDNCSAQRHFIMTKCLLSSSSEKNSTIHDHDHPLELGRFPKPVSDPETFLILSFPPDLGRKFSLRHSSLGTNPGRRCGGTNLPLFTGKLFSFSPFKTGFGKRPDDKEPVRPNGRSEIESGPGSDRGRSEETGACCCWIGLGLDCAGGVGCEMGLGVGRVRTRIRPCLFGAETAEYEADEKEEEDEREGFFEALLVLVVVMGLLS